MSGNVHTVGAIRIAIQSRTASFTRGLRETLTAMDKLKAKARRVTRAISKHWRSATLAIGGMTASLGLAIKKMTDYSSKLVEVSRTAGLATKELENIRALFRGDGIGVGRTDKMMQDFSVRIGEAQRGLATYKRAFEDLGIELRRHDGSWKNQSELLYEVAGALKNTSNTAMASAIAYNLFGRSGKEILPILIKYSDRLEEAAEYAGRFRTLTDEQHKINKNLGQTFSDTTENLSDLVQRGLALAAPYLQTVATQFNDWIVSIKNNPGVMEGLKSFVEGLAKGLVFVAKNIGIVITGFGYMFKAVKTLAEKIADLFTESFDEAREKYVAAAQRLEDHIKAGPAKMLDGRVTFAAQQTFDETTNRLQGQVDQARGVFEAKQVAIRAKKAESDMQNLIRSLAANYPEVSVTGAVEPTKSSTKEPKTYWEIVRENTRKFKGLADIDIAYANGFGDSDRWMEAGKEAGEEVGKGLMLALRTSVMDRRIWIDQAMGWAEELGARMIPNRIPSRRNEGDRALWRWNRRADHHSQSVIDTRRGRHSYHADMFDMPGFPQRYPTSLADTGAFVGLFKDGAGIGAPGFKTSAERDRIRAAVESAQAEAEAAANEFMRRYYGIQAELADADAARVAEEVRKNRAAEVAALEGEHAGDVFMRRYYGIQAEIAAAEKQKSIEAMRARADEQIAAMNADEFTQMWVNAWNSDPAERLAEEVGSMTTFAQEARGAFMRLGDSIVDSFDNAKDALKAFARELVKIGIRRVLLNPLADGLFGKADGSTKGILGFADGGHARGLSLVGERGPELVDFARPGMVYTNAQLKAALGGGGGGGIVIHQSIYSSDGPGVRAALAEATPAIIGAAQARVAESASRPGAFRQAVRGR